VGFGEIDFAAAAVSRCFERTQATDVLRVPEFWRAVSRVRAAISGVWGCISRLRGGVF
jgi:hypothetical protein